MLICPSAVGNTPVACVESDHREPVAPVRLPLVDAPVPVGVFEHDDAGGQKPVASEKSPLLDLLGMMGAPVPN